MIFKREKEIVANIATAVTGYKVTPELLESRTRKREVTIARHVLMVLMLENNMTLTAAGVALNRDHAAVFNARKRVYNDLETGYSPTTRIYNSAKEKVAASILANVQYEARQNLTLQEQIEITKKRAKFREKQAVEDAKRVVEYALEMIHKGRAQGWARHRLRMKVAEIFPEMVLNN